MLVAKNGYPEHDLFMADELVDQKEMVSRYGYLIDTLGSLIFPAKYDVQISAGNGDTVRECRKLVEIIHEKASI